MIAIILTVISLFQVPSFADEVSFEKGIAALENATGCYLVDYNYVETESLKEGYQRDSRVYDVNRDKSVKEWIYSVANSRGIRLQHILFAADKMGKVDKASIIKHQAEDWDFEVPYLYNFVSPLHWEVVANNTTNGLWTRKITNLDDGLRYQCQAALNLDTAYADWSCENYAPIPGRETRDMGRKDYQTLNRLTRVIQYGQNRLERQDNVKTIHIGNEKTPLAKETGKIWHARLPDSECVAAQEFASVRLGFWQVLKQTWDKVLDGQGPFVEKTIPGQPPRFVKMNAVEAKYVGKDLSEPSLRLQAETDILAVINEYRAQ